MLKGISLYTGLAEYKTADIIDCLKKLRKKPIDFIFTSCHITEAKNPNIDIILNEIKDTNIKLVVDFSKRTYDLFEFNPYIIPRLDYGFSVQNILDMLNKHDLIELNASIVNIDLLEQLKSNHADFKKIRVSFNFYPNEFTGMSYDDVKNKVKLFHEFNLAVIIYIPGINKRPPMYKGLPTIEEERYQDLVTNLNEANLLDIDGVCIGDSIVTDEELDLLLFFKENKKEVLELDLELRDNLTKEELEILKLNHIIRVDESPYLIRSSVSRGKFEIKPNNCFDLVKAGSVVINNANLRRYMGELSIIKKDIINNGGMNVVGCINIKPILIKGGSKIIFRF